MGITPPIDISEIDRLHRVGKPEANRTRPVLIKFATYRSKRRVLEKRRFLNPAKRTEARQSLRDVMIGPETEDEAKANHIEKQGSRLFLNDDLTRSRAQLLYECRQAKKKQLITDCWSYDGSIIVKTLTNKISSIKTSSDLKSVSMHTIKYICYPTDMSRTLVLTSLTMFGPFMQMDCIYMTVYLYSCMFQFLYMYTLKSVTYTYMCNHFPKHGCNTT